MRLEKSVVAGCKVQREMRSNGKAVEVTTVPEEPHHYATSVTSRTPGTVCVRKRCCFAIVPVVPRSCTTGWNNLFDKRNSDGINEDERTRRKTSDPCAANAAFQFRWALQDYGDHYCLTILIRLSNLPSFGRSQFWADLSSHFRMVCFSTSAGPISRGLSSQAEADCEHFWSFLSQYVQKSILVKPEDLTVWSHFRRSKRSWKR